jgi:hypothetical protein
VSAQVGFRRTNAKQVVQLIRAFALGRSENHVPVFARQAIPWPLITRVDLPARFQLRGHLL